jgi:hypothetical protein
MRLYAYFTVQYSAGEGGNHTVCLAWTMDKDPRFEFWRSPKWNNALNHAWRRTMMVVAAVVQSTQQAGSHNVVQSEHE